MMACPLTTLSTFVAAALLLIISLLMRRRQCYSRPNALPVYKGLCRLMEISFILLPRVFSRDCDGISITNSTETSRDLDGISVNVTDRSTHVFAVAALGITVHLKSIMYVYISIWCRTCLLRGLIPRRYIKYFGGGLPLRRVMMTHSRSSVRTGGCQSRSRWPATLTGRG